MTENSNIFDNLSIDNNILDDLQKNNSSIDNIVYRWIIKDNKTEVRKKNHLGTYIRIDNIPHVDQYDLISKYLASKHHTFKDEYAEKIIRDEIEKRKNKNEWDYDAPENNKLNYYIYNKKEWE